MAQDNVQTFKEVTLLAKETTFGVLPTMKPLIIEADSWEGEQNRTPLEDMDSSARGLDTLDFVDGVFEGTGKLKAKLKPYASQITSTAPVTQPALFDALECVFGGMQVGAGSAISTGTTSQVTVASDAGFEVGQVVGISGSSDVQIAVVESKPGANVVTFWPNVGVAVTSGTLVNGYNAFVTEDNEKSLSIQHAFVDNSSAQEELRGCHGKAKIVTNINELVMCELDFTAAEGQEGALSVSTSVQTNPLAAGGHAVKNAVVLIQAVGTTTRTHYCVEESSIEFDPGMDFIPCHGTTEGKGGVMRVKGRGLAKWNMTIRFDSDEDTAWTARTTRRVLYSVPKGSGTSKRHVFAYAPYAVLARAPKRKKSGGRLLLELEFILKINNASAANSIAGSPLIVGAL